MTILSLNILLSSYTSFPSHKFLLTYPHPIFQDIFPILIPMGHDVLPLTSCSAVTTLAQAS